jgi:hypothetical protein
MKKLTEKQIAKIEAARSAISDLNKLQETVYTTLCEECDLDEEDSWLFDYIFNDYGRNDSYSQMVKDKVYGN